MARSDVRFRLAHNSLVETFSMLMAGSALPSESALAAQAGVSRTVVRTVLRRLEAAGIVAWSGRDKTLLRPPNSNDKLPVQAETLQPEDLEREFFEWVLRFDVPAGTPLNITQLARQFGVHASVLQELLASLSHFGLVERRARGGWTLLGFTANFAIELSEFRSVLELNALQHLLACHVDHPVWTEIEALRLQHLDLETRVEADFHDFSKLDERFHACLNAVVKNRFITQFNRVISLIFHYHFMWDKRDERSRNAAAIREHLAIIEALQSRDEEATLAAGRRHLRTSMTTLLSSLRDHRLA